MAAADAAAPGHIESAEFAALLAACGSFEDRPEIAVAVSGGADSLALTLLLQDWVAVRGGRLFAFTVDHGLRRESRDEAEGVGRLCRTHDIRHRILTWRGTKPSTGVQAAAREARSRLLEAACVEESILHLCLAQHADDQAETFLLRLESGSGPLGLAAMPAVSYRPGLRLLRPLLGLPKERLRATLRRRGVAWIEDPSNRAPAYRRSALRQTLARLEAAGLAAARFAETAAGLGAARRTLEREAERLLAGHVALLPAGYAWLDPEGLRQAPREVARQALSALLRSLSGAAYPPRGTRLDALLDRLLAGLTRGVTLAGCRILPRRQGLLLCREPAQVETLTLDAATAGLWDGRFRIVVSGKAAKSTTLGPLTSEGWQELAAASPALRRSPIPGAVRPSLPALRVGNEIAAVPHLGWWRAGNADNAHIRCIFAPKNPLTSVPFTVA